MERQIKHISEEDLERYAAFVETLTEDKRRLIQRHLSSCAHCSAQLNDVGEFYRKLDSRLKQEPLEQDKTLAESLTTPTSTRFLPFRGIQKTNRGIVDAVFEPVPAKSLILARTFTYVKEHPFTIGSVALGIAILILTFNIERGNLQPTISGVTPQTLVGKNSYDTLSIVGTGFRADLKVRLKDIPNNEVFDKLPQSASGKSIVLALRVGTDPGKWSVQILNPNGKQSNVVEFAVIAPKPQRPWLIPDQAIAGSPAFYIIVTGNTYNSSSIVRWNGQDRHTVPIVTEGGLVMGLKVALPASDISVPGRAQVTVFTPPPGGGVSSPATFEVVPKSSKQ